ncbi:DUF4352 domain-containing protein [Rhizomonospora bruguierae]|uniref:hypothetical protein n=1 Tax=Rhizomonospora bruguierae TaxID=1581705 RepID=UPI001BCFA69D|nr:hypothetical protein [Micromonospora sp. NBRC 107566]
MTYPGVPRSPGAYPAPGSSQPHGAYPAPGSPPAAGGPDADDGGRRGRLRSRFGAGLLIVAALAVGTLIRSGTPDVDTAERPFSRAGVIGRPVDARTFDATVLAVRGAAKIHRDGGLTGRQEHDTDGVWILLKVRLEAHDHTIQVGWAGLKDGKGRTFHSTERITQPLIGGRSLQPGIPLTGEVVFEVPKDAATNVTLQLTERPIDRRMAAMVEVPLPISPSAVDGWLANPAPVQIENPVVG